MEKPPAIFKIVFGCFSSGSSSKQHQENHADNTNETVTHFNRCHQHFPNLSNSIDGNPRRMVIRCDEIAQKLLENTSPAVHNFEFFKSGCGNKSTCTCSGNSLRYGLLLDVAFRELFAIKESFSPPYRTYTGAKGTKWWPSMAPLQIGMCRELRT